MSKFENAIKNREIFDFIVGNKEYFIQDREYDGHNPLQSYKQYAEKYFHDTGNYIFEDTFWSNVVEELLNSKDYNIFLENLISFLLPYYSINDTEVLKNRVVHTPYEFITVLRDTINLNKGQLIEDTRGIGVEWNVSNRGLGIYGGVLFLINLIQKRSGLNLGSDFITDTINE